MVTEELARAWMSVASIIARGNGLVAGFSAAQREAILPRVARGEYLGAFALSRARRRFGHRLDPHPCRARRRRVGDHRTEDVVHVRRPGRLPDRRRPHDAVRPAPPACRHPALLRPEGARQLPARRRRQRRSARSATSAGRRGSCRSTVCACRPTTCSPARRQATTRVRRSRGFREVSRTLSEARVHTARPRDRPGARRARGLGRLLPAAPAVRPPDRRLPGAAVQGRPDGRRDRGLPGVHVPGRRRRRRRGHASIIRRRCSSSSPARWPSG